MQAGFARNAVSRVVGTLAFALAATSISQAADELSVSVWGGTYAERFRKEVVEPFEKKFGVSVTLDTGLSSERLSKLIATRGRGIDLLYLTDYQMAEAAKRGLLQPIDPKRIGNLESLHGFARDPLGGNLCPAFTVLGVGLAYNKDQFAQPPQSWADLWRAGLPGKVGFPDMGVSYGPLTLVAIAKLNGGGIDNLEPAFAKLKEIKARLQIFTRQDVLDAINQGNVSLAPHLNIFVTRDESVPLRFAWPKEGGLGVLNLACVIKGSQSPDLAQKFIDFHLSKEIQEAMLRSQGETPVNKEVAVPADLKFNVVAPDEAEKLQFFDVKKLVEKRNALVERWQEEVIAR